MNYDNPELQHRLAAAFVLGTLQGRARDRFIRLLAEKPALQRVTRAWEARLNPWSDALPPQKVPDQVWANIRARLGLAAEEKTRWTLDFWRGWAIASTAMAAVLAGLLVLRPPVASGPAATPVPVVLTDVAVLSSGKAEPVWVVRADRRQGRLVLSSLQPVTVASDRDLELWSIPADGKPRSLGVLTVRGQQAEVVLSAERQALLGQATVLAISLEPTKGSPTGLPTGPVLFTGKPVKV